MTNRENMKKVIKNDFDKANNYKKIVEGMNEKKIKFNYKYATIPTIVIIIFVLIIGVSTKNNKAKQLENGGDDWSDGINATTSSNTNHIDTSDSDSSLVEINEINDIIKNRGNTKIVNNVNIPYLEILTNLEIPNDFDNKEDYRAVYIKNDTKSLKEDYILNNYEFHYKNTKNEREIVVSFSKDFTPISNYNFGVNSKSSLVNGINVLLYKYEKTYIAKFQYMKYNFLVEGKNISSEEFMNFVSSIIK